MLSAIKLLFVEDEPIIQGIVEVGLEDQGFSVVIKADGASALTELEASALSYQAVLTDIRLGTGPSGWDVGRRARELVPNMPIIYMSADSGADWTAYGVPASIMVPKPFVIAQLVAAVVELLNKDDV